jgi:alkaline phosphatase D
MKKTPPTFTRRKLIKGISAASLLPILGSNLIGCSDSSDRGPAPEPPIESVPAQFNHGVASGDPLPDAVILWTRLTPERDGNVVVQWEVATDEGFTDIVASGSGTTTADVDYTVKVDAGGLDPDSVYYYRFITGDTISPVGRTRTVPSGALSTATFAVVSCSNYPAGYFHVYREIADQQVDAVLHLGDYLYEYGKDEFGSEMAEELGRVVEPETELLSLSDYRTRYAQYHTDPDLQACHSAHPFIIVWDDHEVANDAWRDGADNHDPETEGEYGERRAAAIQAWYEWLPVRPPSSEQEIIYRRFQYGDLVDLLMLDTRHVGRDKQIDYADYTNGDLIDVDGVRAAFGDSNRTLLGTDQRAWLKSRLTDSNARWQVLGQQVLMARIALPEPVTRLLNAAAEGEASLEEGIAAVFASLNAKNKPPEERTPEEQALLDSAIPYNLDSWDGYGFEREEILAHAAQVQSRLVALAGDTHNGWASQLTTADGIPVGVEFAGPSVSSPGIEYYLGLEPAELLGPVSATLVDDLKYANLVNRGYLAVTFSPDDVKADWRYVSGIDTPEYSLLEEAAKQLSVSRDDLLLG